MIAGNPDIQNCHYTTPAWRQSAALAAALASAPAGRALTVVGALGTMSISSLTSRSIGSVRARSHRLRLDGAPQ